jgi:hypothetical protein
LSEFRHKVTTFSDEYVCIRDKNVAAWESEWVRGLKVFGGFRVLREHFVFLGLFRQKFVSRNQKSRDKMGSVKKWIFVEFAVCVR